ncbi:MAG: hypothetical protein KDC53_25175, partial [Saprospiraceae bacterium]|nr:hypothetical protein [Saprospiraceae bacterium]
AGLAISYLINSQFEDGNNGKNLARYDEATGQFRRSELNALLGGGFALTEKLGILFRTTIGLNHLYYNSDVIDVVARLPPEQRNDPDVPLVLLRNYLVSVGIYYLL